MVLLERIQGSPTEEDVAPSFHVERRRSRTPLQVVRDAIVVFNRRTGDHIQETIPVPPRTFERRHEPPLETLVRPMPNFPAGRTSRSTR
jgi:hypothetical protein